MEFIAKHRNKKNNILKDIVKRKWKIVNKLPFCLLDLNLPLDNSDVLRIKCGKASFIYKLY